MIIAIDIGNSNILIGGIQNDEIVFEARLRTDATKTSDEYCIDLKMILDIYHVDTNCVEGAIIASVVPQVMNTMKTELKKLTGISSMVVGPGIKTGLNLKVENPAQTGADLVAGCVGALKEHDAPLIVVDMGTATTIMIVDESGSFIGGCIYPGVKTSLEALTERTALLPGLQIDQPKRTIGRNTVDCMRSGIMYGTASMLDGMIERMETELGYKTTVVATGGLSRFIVPLCKTNMIYDRNLILKGLSAIYRENSR